jgi:Fe-S oxidoreductase
MGNSPGQMQRGAVCGLHRQGDTPRNRTFLRALVASEIRAAYRMLRRASLPHGGFQRIQQQLETERLVCYCGSCTHSFRNIWRQYLGVTLPFEIVSVWEWLWEKIRDKELVAQRTISKKIALSDSCYGSELGDPFFAAVRGLHEAAGFEVVELKNNRYDNHCCGMVTILRNDFDFMQPLKVAQRKIEQVKEAGAPGVACYCPGCLMRLGGPAKKAGLESRYSLEDILWAFGDEYSVPLRKRLSLQGRLVLERFQKYMARSSK